MLAANRMTPPRYPLGPSRQSSRRQRAHCGRQCGLPPDTPSTYRPPGQFRSGGENKKNFQIGTRVSNAFQPRTTGPCGMPKGVLTIPLVRIRVWPCPVKVARCRPRVTSAVTIIEAVIVSPYDVETALNSLPRWPAPSGHRRDALTDPAAGPPGSSFRRGSHG
jgi:hypothetical protein